MPVSTTAFRAGSWYPECTGCHRQRKESPHEPSAVSNRSHSDFLCHLPETIPSDGRSRPLSFHCGRHDLRIRRPVPHPLRRLRCCRHPLFGGPRSDHLLRRSGDKPQSGKACSRQGGSAVQCRQSADGAAGQRLCDCCSWDDGFGRSASWRRDLFDRCGLRLLDSKVKEDGPALWNRIASGSRERIQRSCFLSSDHGGAQPAAGKRPFHRADHKDAPIADCRRCSDRSAGCLGGAATAAVVPFERCGIDGSTSAWLRSAFVCFGVRA